jgi:hypothetical protein
LLQVKRQWEQLNPEYRVIVYGDTQCIRILSHFFGPKYVDIFSFLKDGPIKCDFFRACLMYVCGGVYVDADIQPLVPLSDYIDDTIDFVTCLSFDYRADKQNYCYNPHFIACAKGSLEMQAIIGKYEQMFDQQVPYDYWTWSICNLFEKIVEIPKPEETEEVIRVQGRVYRFLIETIRTADNQDYTCFNSAAFLQQIANKSVRTPVQFQCHYLGRPVLLNFGNKKSTPVACDLSATTDSTCEPRFWK